jgi:Kdo2-lipid IVA lauroyltransferase/acyltransferase
MKEYTQYRIAGLLSRVVPRRLAYWIGLRAADVFFRKDARGRAAVVANLRRIHEWKRAPVTDADLALMARRTFQAFGKYLVDFFRFANMTEGQIRKIVSIEGWEHMEQVKALGRGGLLVTAHFGNWELGGCAMGALGFPIHAVVLAQPSEKINRLFQEYRRKRGMTVIPLGKAVRRVLKLLAEKQFVGLLADRDYAQQEVSVDFFGAPARLPRGPAWLCSHSGAPILTGFVIRRKDDSFLMRLYPPIVPGDGMTPEDIQSRLCGILEREIGADPTQWMMFENLWNHGAYSVSPAVPGPRGGGGEPDAREGA